MSKIDITPDELRAMLQIADTDPGMFDLLQQTKEYYLLKRVAPPVRTADTILERLRARSRPRTPLPAETTADPTPDNPADKILARLRARSRPRTPLPAETTADPMTTLNDLANLFR